MQRVRAAGGSVAIHDEDLDVTPRLLRGARLELLHLGGCTMQRSATIAQAPGVSAVPVHATSPALLRITAAPTHLALICTAAGSPPVRIRARPLIEGTCLAAGPRGAFEAYLPGDCRAFVLCASRRAAVASTSEAHAPEARRTELRALTPEQFAALRRCMELIENPGRSRIDDEDVQEERRRLCELLDEQAATLFSSSLSLAPAPGERARRLQAVERACAHIERRLSEPTALDDLCRVAGVRARTLEYGFRQLFDVGPITYLRSVRLCRVRSALLQPRGQGVTVSETARRLGFAHMSQFSRDYGRSFGENPSATLARASRRLAGAAREPSPDSEPIKLSAL